MKNTNALLKKYTLVILAALISGITLFKNCDSKHETPLSVIDQRNITNTRTDSLTTAKANILLNKKDSTIQALKLRIAKEKANTATQKAEATKQHAINDTLQARFERDKQLKTCVELVRGLKSEIADKDSIIVGLDTIISKQSNEVKELEGKVEIQKGIIESKQNLIACKDSTINLYRLQKRKDDFWYMVKIKIVGAILFIETIGLILK